VWDGLAENRLENPVFVVGMGRSGTTLLASVLSRHPALAIAPETHYLTRWRRHAPDLERGCRDRFDRFWDAFTAHRHFMRLGIDADVVRGRILGDGPPDHRTVFASLLRAYAEKWGKVRWGEKTPGHWRTLALLLTWFPEARVVFLVRDPRAVVASRRETQWARGSLDVEIGRWRDSVRTAEWYDLDERVRIMRYEDLVTQPLSQVADICRYVQLDFDAAMLERPARHAAAKPRPGGPISADRVSRWRSVLSQAETRMIERLAGKEMRRHGYALEASSGTAS